MQVNEVFQSISGEVGLIPQGAVSWFIRFQNCNLSCSWCDAEYARKEDSQYPSQSLTPEQIIEQIPAYSNVILTGGEPLLQDKRDMILLTSELLSMKCRIQIETNGSFLPYLPVCHIFDYKTPSSGMENKMIAPFSLIAGILGCPGGFQTWIKFVAKTPSDLERTFQVLLEIEASKPPWLVLHPAISVESHAIVDYAMNRLQELMPEKMHKIVFNFQIHKHLDLR